jgi:hypothetical protein
MTSLHRSVLIIIAVTTISAYGQTSRRASGIIYFTNNTPKNLRTFPVEILKANTKRVAVTYLDEHSRFAFDNLKPGQYLLRLTWPKHCVLSYRLDLSKQSNDDIKIIMDAACAHDNGKIRELPSN